MIKKILIISLIFLVTGCTSNSGQSDYSSHLKSLKEKEFGTEKHPYNIIVNYDKYSDEEYIYQVVIDKVTTKMDDVKVVVYHDQKTTNSFPSLGFFDDTVDLDKDSKTKGINLIGYFPTPTKNPIVVKILVIYNSDSKNVKDYHIFELNRK